MRPGLASATAAASGATIAAGRSWATATAPAVPAPPCWNANTSMATHTPYSAALNPANASSTRLRAGLRSVARRTGRAPPPSVVCAAGERDAGEDLAHDPVRHERGDVGGSDRRGKHLD